MNAEQLEAYIHGYSEVEQQRLRDQAEILAPIIFQGLDLSETKNILEIGCGVGAQTKKLLQRWPHLRSVSIDRGERQLLAAKDYLSAEIQQKQVSLRCEDACKLSFQDAQFDAVICIWVLEHIPDPAQVLSEAKRVLRPGGKLILVEVDNSTLRFDPHSSIIQNWWDIFNDYQIEMGGDPFIGRRLEGMLDELGFQNTRTHDLLLAAKNSGHSSASEQLQWLKELLLSASEGLERDKKVTPEATRRLAHSFSWLEVNPNADFFYAAKRFVTHKR